MYCESTPISCLKVHFSRATQTAWYVSLQPRPQTGCCTICAEKSNGLWLDHCSDHWVKTHWASERSSMVNFPQHRMSECPPCECSPHVNNLAKGLTQTPSKGILERAGVTLQESWPVDSQRLNSTTQSERYIYPHHEKLEGGKVFQNAHREGASTKYLPSTKSTDANSQQY